MITFQFSTPLFVILFPLSPFFPNPPPLFFFSSLPTLLPLVLPFLPPFLPLPFFLFFCFLSLSPLKQMPGRVGTEMPQSDGGVVSLAWIPDKPDVLVAGIGSKWLRLFDVRGPGECRAAATTRGAYCLSMDPHSRNLIASYSADVCLNLLRSFSDSKDFLSFSFFSFFLFFFFFFSCLLDAAFHQDLGLPQVTGPARLDHLCPPGRVPAVVPH
jgi:hypothetical protein